MKYKEGDKVRIKKDLEIGKTYGCLYSCAMDRCAIEHNYVLKIIGINLDKSEEFKYVMLECCFPIAYEWSEEMIEGLYEEPAEETARDTNVLTKTTREECLEKAKEIVCKGRQEYGGVEDNFQAIASYWSAYLGRDIFPKDVAIMMVLLKIARDSTGTFKADNYIDLCGYAACACELASSMED